jgi:hypothetical protein
VRPGLVVVAVVTLGCGGGGDQVDPDAPNAAADADPCADVPADCLGETFECAETGGCYLRCRGELAWAAAADACRAWGGALVTIETLEENACIAPRIPEATVWIGLHEAAPGAWSWDSGSASTWTNWHTDQPDDVGSGGETVEVDCVRMNNNGSFHWLDETCPRAYDYVCER